MGGRTYGQTDGWMDGRTEGRVGGFWVGEQTRRGGKTFISAHLFFYSTYNICQKQDTHPHGHILDIYFVFERPATDSERVSISSRSRSRSRSRSGSRIGGIAGSPDG